MGYIVPLFLTSYFGRQLFDWMKDAPPSTWAAIAVGVVTLFGGVWVFRRCRTRPADEAAAP